jgi:argininosuccinate synthase
VDPWATPPPDAYEWTVDPGQAPDIPPELTIGFVGGIPVSLDGTAVGPVELIERVHALGGRHGVGRIDHVEDRLVGIKSREIYEAPAATILHTAHAALETLTLSKEQLRFNRLVADELAQATYDGIWFSALHRDLREYIRSAQRVVSGQVRMRLDHGSATSSAPAMTRCTTARWTYDADDAYDHAASVSFIRIFGLPLRTEAARHDSGLDDGADARRAAGHRDRRDPSGAAQLSRLMARRPASTIR